MTHTTPEDSEILDLVNSNDEVIGELDRAEAYKLADGIGYIRAAEAFIINDKGQLWVPVRTLTKKISPGGFDFSAAEHVGKGESYDDAMVRGFSEELNLDLTINDLEFAGVIGPDLEKQVYYFRAIYIYRTNDSPQFNTDDFSGAIWMSSQELRHKIASGSSAKTVIMPTIDYLESRDLL